MDKLTDFYSTPKQRTLEDSVTQHEAEALRELTRHIKATRTLEIGLAAGASAVAIVDALERSGKTDARHVALDPYQEEWDNVGLSELSRLGLLHLVDFLPQRSEEYLFEAIRRKERFDLIFHDGDHSIGNKVADAFLADQCLNVGGVLAFHDGFKEATAACVKYLVLERGYSVVDLPPDSTWKRLARCLKYGMEHGRWYGMEVVPHTARSVVAVQKEFEKEVPSYRTAALKGVESSVDRELDGCVATKGTV